MAARAPSGEPSALARRGWQALYNVVLLPLFVGAVRVAALRSAKLRDTLAGHRGLWARLESALAGRDAGRPLLWFHVASAGEFLQALPVLERCAGADAQIALTLTSVSGYRWAQRRRAELPGLLLLDYLPFDTRANVRRLLALLQPAALIYTKYDLWPNLVWGAARAGVPQYLLAATLHERSRRLRWAPARSLYRTLYAPLAGIYAVSEADAERFLRTAPGHRGVAVLGDSRVDSVLDRRARMAPPPLPPYAMDAQDAAQGTGQGTGQGTVLAVGSSWPADEQRILPGLREALADHAGLRVLLVPHETDPAHLERLERFFAAFRTERFTRLGSATEPWRVLLVDTVGLLAALYAHAQLAYVGGAFSTGVHNVMEPAAMGIPPIFGPFHENSPEAVHLRAAGLAFAIGDAEDFRRVLRELLDDPARRAGLGARARAYVESQAGAAQRAYARIRADLGAAWPTAGGG